MTSYQKKLLPASPQILEMYARGLQFSLNMAATVAVAEVEAVGVVDTAYAEDALDTVEAVE